MKTLMLIALLLAAPLTQANVICTGCEDGEAVGNFLGRFNGGDLATFQNSDVGRGAFSDFWVFDLTPLALGSLSADFTILAAITGFVGELYRDAGSVCSGFDCSSVDLGSLIGAANATAGRWELVDFLNPGRYVLRIGGRSAGLIDGAYTGQMAFIAVAIQEPGTLALLGLGLMALGGLVWRRSR